MHELHCHLYGCLSQDDLRFLANRRPPRDYIYRQSYRNIYGSDIDFQSILENSESLYKHSVFKGPGNFLDFQLCFDCVISLSHTDPDELMEITQRVHSRQKTKSAEYRMMFSPALTSGEYKEKIEGLLGGAVQGQRANSKSKLGMAVSLSRETSKAMEQFEVIKNFRNHEGFKHLTAIDFCGFEGNPADLKPILEKIHLLNESLEQRLAILIHAGEDYSSLSIERSIARIIEAIEVGADRIGHALTLGLDTGLFLGQEKMESIGDRIAQIHWENEHIAELQSAGYHIDSEAHQTELEELQKQERGFVKVRYDSKRIEQLSRLQKWAMAKVRKSQVIIESCPISNMRIASLSLKDHPLKRLLSEGIRVVVGADDPGIFDSSLEQDLDCARKMGVTTNEIDEILKTMDVAQSPRMKSLR